MAIPHSIERVSDLMDQYTGANVVGGDYNLSPIQGQVQDNNFLRLDFDAPVDINAGHVAGETGYRVEVSDDGRSVTFRP